MDSVHTYFFTTTSRLIAKANSRHPSIEETITRINHQSNNREEGNNESQTLHGLATTGSRKMLASISPQYFEELFKRLYNSF